MSKARFDEKGIVITCPQCGQMSRIPYNHLADTGRCSNCRAAIPPPSAPIDLNQAKEFDLLLKASPVPVVVDFWAPWCGPCKMVAPELKKVAAKAAGEFLVVKINTEALPELGQRHQVRSIPTMSVFTSGQEISRTAGARPAPAIESFIREAIQAEARRG